MPYEPHDLFDPPPDEARIWRYLDFTKFVSLIDTATLHFTRADHFDDAFEGSYPSENLARRSDPSWHSPIQGRWAMAWIRYTFLNCWSLGDHESAAMWGLYLSTPEGIAVRSRFSRLVDALEKTREDVHIGRVKYLDYQREVFDEGNVMQPFLHKRLSFEHEHELRALIPKIDDYNTRSLGNQGRGEPPTELLEGVYPEGVDVAVDLDALVEAVHISPIAPSWFADLVRSVIRRYDFDFTVTQSSLAGSPVY